MPLAPPPLNTTATFGRRCPRLSCGTSASAPPAVHPRHSSAARPDVLSFEATEPEPDPYPQAASAQRTSRGGAHQRVSTDGCENEGSADINKVRHRHTPIPCPHIAERTLLITLLIIDFCPCITFIAFLAPSFPEGLGGCRLPPVHFTRALRTSLRPAVHTLCRAVRSWRRDRCLFLRAA